MRLLLVLIATFFVLSPVKAIAGWSVVTSDHFEVYSEGNVKDQKAFTVKLEKFDAMLRALTGLADDGENTRMKVFLVRNRDHVRRFFGTKSKFVAGFYTTNARSAVAVVPRSVRDRGKYALSSDAILFHEYTHHFFMQYYTATYPAWYREGAADFFSTAEFKKGNEVSLGLPAFSRIPSIKIEGIYDVSKLLTQESRGLNGRDSNKFYATAWLLTHFLISESSRAGELGAYLNALNRGKSNDEAIAKFSGGMKGLAKDLKAYGNRRRLNYKKFFLKNLPKQFAMEVKPLREARSEAFEFELALLANISKDNATVQLPKLKKLALKRDESAHINWLLGEYSKRAGDQVAANQYFDTAITLDPKHSTALASKAQMLLAQSKKMEGAEKIAVDKKAMQLVSRANRSDTEDPVPLFLFHVYSDVDEKKAENMAFLAIEKAHALLPQNAQYRLALVSAYANKREFMKASILLKPLAFSAHQTESSIKLREFYDSLLMMDKKDSEVVEEDIEGSDEN